MMKNYLEEFFFLNMLIFWTSVRYGPNYVFYFKIMKIKNRMSIFIVFVSEMCRKVTLRGFQSFYFCKTTDVA